MHYISELFDTSLSESLPLPLPLPLHTAPLPYTCTPLTPAHLNTIYTSLNTICTTSISLYLYTARVLR
jgi:hypothetical protein